MKGLDGSNLPRSSGQSSFLGTLSRIRQKLHIGGRIRGLLSQQLNPTVGVQDQETVLEWNYTFRFRNGAFFFEPDVQYIIRPGGTGNIPNALVVGAQTGINF